jgi:hypothetical protein
MQIAILFESSGIVRDAFRALGHFAISCDLKPSERPGPHIQGDVLALDWPSYDLIIAHPPCTYMALSGNRHYANTTLRQEAADLIAHVWTLPATYLCIENPVGQINTYLPYMPKPQYIQPYQFGHDASKRTGLWLRNLPDLEPTKLVLPMHNGRYANQTPSGQNKLGPSPTRQTERSRTYSGIAEAMAAQWSAYIQNQGAFSWEKK